MPLDDLDGPRRLPGRHQHLSEAPIREIRIERYGPLELSDRGIMLAPANKNTSKLGTRLGQVRVELHGSSGKIVGPVEGGRI